MLQREQLRSLRKRLGVPQVRLCAALGIDRASFNLWENGWRQMDENVIRRVEEYLANELAALQSLVSPLERVQ